MATTKLSWNEIRNRAIQFSRRWQEETRERSESQSFWNEFFDVFGLERKLIATFDEPVRTLKDTYGFIDMFWKGRLLAEHKSAGQSLEKATTQAFDYIQDLASSDRSHEIPRYIIVSDFQNIVLHDLAPEDQGELFRGRQVDTISIPLADFHKNIKHFAFVIGQRTHKQEKEDPANLIAAQLMADLHDAVEAGGYSGPDLERLLVRLLFCVFADDTGIFSANQFELWLENTTRKDGSDLGAQLANLFQILDTPGDRRQKNTDEVLAEFPYVNGELFAERLPLVQFNTEMRNRLLAACRFDWSRISPAIFGSLFQGIMDAAERRQLGAHYTSERDILKLVRPLVLDDLRVEFDQLKALTSARRRQRLLDFQNKLSQLRFLDPACGCGNFLVVTYRELRRLELDVLKEMEKSGWLDFGKEETLSKVTVDQFYAIEIGQWAVRIAETALWLTDHQMNNELSLAFGNPFDRIPIESSPHIRCANALRFDWNDLLPAEKCSFILGNPPFVGAKFQTTEQKSDVRRVVGNIANHGLLDYVTLWYFRALDYVDDHKIRCAFVSTSSISQGEQVGVLWTALFQRGARIQFAHRTFAWRSEARGPAHVHVVIIGFGTHDIPNKRIFEYTDIQAEPSEVPAGNINPYLLAGNDIIIKNRSRPLCDVPEIGIGNKPIDGGNYLFNDEERLAFIRTEPKAERFFRPWIGSDEFLNGYHRWCLWLGDATPAELRDLPKCRERIERVRMNRLDSVSLPTQRLAETPRRFHVENFPLSEFLVIPEVSSEKRPYIPIGYLSPPVICSNLVKIMHDANPYHFGVLTSEMHMAWVRQVCGRLESRYRYSAKLVYNNFPWPQNPTAAQRAKVESCAQRVLDVRQPHLDAGSTLADLYDPLTMPADLLKAHQELDRAVDRCYLSQPFTSERERVEFLFQLYEQLTAPLAPTPKPRAKRNR